MQTELKYLETLQQSIPELTNTYSLVSEKSFGFWDPNDSTKRLTYWQSAPIWWNYKLNRTVTKKIINKDLVDLVSQYSTKRAVGWLSLAPKSIVPRHRHLDMPDTTILQIPLIIPNGNVGTYIAESGHHIFKSNEMMAFTATKYHIAYNNTKEHRVTFNITLDSTWNKYLKTYGIKVY